MAQDAPPHKSTLPPEPQAFSLYDLGKDGMVDYAKYGKFTGVGTENYQYVVTDPKGLAAAVGEGIYPNTSALKDPAFLAIKDKLTYPTENFGFWPGDMKNPQADLFRWACGKQDDGTKTFMASIVFTTCKMWIPALKADYALLVHFPAEARANSKDSWTWYATYGNWAKNNIVFILREHPELGLEYKDWAIDVENAGKPDQRIVKINPGRFVKAAPKPPVKLEKIIRQLPNPDSAVKLVQYENHHWLMMVDGKPYFIRGMCYGVTKIGMSPDIGNMVGYGDQDNLHGVFDSWVDKNGNFKQDPDEPVVGDQNLLKEMGCNTIRNYFSYGMKTTGTLDRLWKEAGIRSAIGVAFGAYGLESGSGWDPGTDYTNPQQQQNMLDALKKVVLRFKDKPYTLCYILGNENNYDFTHTNAGKVPAVFCDFLNRACKMVHQLDPNHPVGPCIGEGFSDQVIRYAPEVDFIGMNVYRGKNGMGDLWETMRAQADKPILITEFGASAFSKELGENGDVQAEYIAGNWKDMWYNRGGGQGYGNSLGGFVFEWQDEWWKAGNWKPANKHDMSGGGEEWLGVMSQGNGNDSPAMREIRPAYWTLKDMWTGKYATAP